MYKNVKELVSAIKEEVLKGKTVTVDFHGHWWIPEKVDTRIIACIGIKDFDEEFDDDKIMNTLRRNKMKVSICSEQYMFGIIPIIERIYVRAA